MKHWRWLLPIPIIAVIALMIYGATIPDTVIVEGRVTEISPYQGHYLAQVEATKAFPDYRFFETISTCNLPVNTTVDIAVHTTGMLQGHQPTDLNVALYQAQGIGFVPWNGC